MRRWVTLVAVSLVGCALPVFDEFDDGAKPVVVRQRIDPCAWDGGGGDVCYAVTAEVSAGSTCGFICGVPGSQPGIFEVGQCAAFCSDIDPCEVRGAVERDAGTTTGWIFEEGTCVPVGGTSRPQPGVFGARHTCEQSCSCDVSVFEGEFSPWCDVELEVEPGTVPPVPSFHLEGQRYLAESRGIRSLNEMCRIGRAPYVKKVRCVSPR